MAKTSITMSDEIHKWYKTQAEKVGVPLNSMMVFALLQYKQEQEEKEKK